MTWKLARLVIDLRDRHGSGGRVEFPAFEPGEAVVAERPENVLLEHLVVDAQVDDDAPIRCVVRVHRMERISDRHIDPYDVGCGAVARK